MIKTKKEFTVVLNKEERDEVNYAIKKVGMGKVSKESYFTGFKTNTKKGKNE